MKKPIFILVLAISVISTAAGAMFMMSLVPSDEIRSYLNEFMWNLKSGVQNKNIFLNALRDNFFTLAAIFICGFFKPGLFISLFVTARKCFVSAFAVSAFMYYYNLNGFFTAAILALPFMILITALIIFCSVSVSLSIHYDRFSEIRSFIAFCFVCALTFTAAAVAEGYIVPQLALLVLH